MNNPATIEAVMQKFEKQARDAVEQITQSLVGQDLVAATRTAHSLKGAASMVAADGLSSAASEIEQLGRQQQADEMQRQLSKLQEEVVRCVSYLPQVRAIVSRRLATTPTENLEV